MSYKIPEGAGHILQVLADSGYEAHLVGGCVRDLLRGVQPHDWDICTSALPQQTQACFAGCRIIETGLKHGTVTVMWEGTAFEVTTYRVDGAYSDGRRPDSVVFVPKLEEDLARRDFTMNAIAMDLGGGLRDPFHGADDIRDGLIRCVGDADCRFQEDGLRIMRALRFAAVFGYAIERETADAVHRSRAMLRCVAAERIQSELCRLLCGPNVGPVLREFPDVLCEFWPELAPLVSLEQNNPWHCWGGWEHTVRAVEAAPPEVVPRLTMLLHDIGKPSVKTTDEDGIDHFYGHPAVSGALAEELLARLKFDRNTFDHVTTLVRSHDVVMEPKARVVRRLLNKLGPENFYLLVEVHRADNMGQAFEKVKDRLAVLDTVKALADEIIAGQQCFSLKDLAVTGRDVMAAGVAAGPEVGRVLNSLLERVMNEELPNERAALLEAVRRDIEFV